ncbi:MAG: RIP metalloprotease RseP [Candidatus Eisenbacteria bacterium]
MIFDVVLPGLLLLGILVFLHESGHFVMAKILGVPVYKFSLGFGPKLIGFRKGDTQYQLSALPLGGYVSMAEETQDADGKPDLVDRFSEAPWWKRFVIALAGPGANFITGYVALVIMGLVGIHVPDFEPVLGPSTPGAPATVAGLAPGARLVSIDGSPISSFQEFLRRADQVPPGDPLRFVVEAPGGETQTITLPSGERQAALNALQPPEAASSIGAVVIGTPAYTAGLAAGDRIVTIEGKPVARWKDLTAAITGSPGKPLHMVVERGTRTFPVTITPQGPPTPGAWEGGRIGIEAPRTRTYLVRSAPAEAVADAWPLTLALVKQTFEGLATVITRPVQSASSLGGPQMIVQIAGANAKRGAGDFIYILAVISFAIMAFNLLPLPVLDGGHLFLSLIEAVRRRPPAEWFTLAYQRVGLVLIGGFIVFVLFNDLSRSIQHRAAVHRNNQAPAGDIAPTR